MPIQGTPPAVYKTISLQQAKNRITKPLTEAQKTKASKIVSSFVQYMLKQHA